MNYLKLSVKEVVFLFKCTSWIFGPIEIEKDMKDEAFTISESIFIKKGIKKNYIGLISKYIVDLARVFNLIQQGFDVFYLKYCDNEITTENNLIFALNKSKEDNK